MNSKKHSWNIIETQDESKTIKRIEKRFEGRRFRTIKGYQWMNRTNVLTLFGAVKENDVVILDKIESVEWSALEALKLIITQEKVILPSGVDMKLTLPSFTFIALTNSLTQVKKNLPNVNWDNDIEL